MKKVFFALMAVVFGLLIFSCSNGSTESPPANRIIIEGISDINSIESIAVWISPSIPTELEAPSSPWTQPEITAINGDVTTDNKLILDLVVPYRFEGKYNSWSGNDENWTGTGDFHIILIPITAQGTNNNWVPGSGGFDYKFANAKKSTTTVSFNSSPVTVNYTNDFVNF